MLNCCVTDTNDAPWRSRTLDDLGEVRQRPGQPVHLVDHHDIDAALLAHPPRGAARPGRSMLPPEKPPSSYAVFTSFQPSWAWLLIYAIAGLPLGVQGIERLVEPLFRRLAGVDGTAANNRLHRRGSRNPKNTGPDHLVPVISLAISDRDLWQWPRYSKPSSMTATRWVTPLNSRVSMVPGLRP